MSPTRWYTPSDGSFQVLVPAGWQAEDDSEEGGVELWGPEELGVLHLVSFPQPPGELPDPAEELYAFLAEQEIDLEEDEVEDVELDDGGELSLCEYVSEDDEEEGATTWVIGVAALPGSLVFGHYSCAHGDEERERAAVHAILGSLRVPPTTAP